jgi:hypothetical protein
LSRFRKHMTYANAVATLALVFAMSGGAYAASKFIITSTKQISPKVLKQLKGSAGSKGSQGPAGPAGPQGAPGAAGAKGENGQPGKEGQAGKDGENGKEGSPWTAGGTLPANATETGAWAVDQTPTPFFNDARASISFTIPLAKRLTAAKVNIIAPGKTGAGGGTCPTSSSVGKPEAEPGNLCIFEAEDGTNVGAVETINPETNEKEEAGVTGTVIDVRAEEPSKTILELSGTWAVKSKEA